ncbi:hypothetical protein Agub_g1883, partial [Astrephomene gubernaculifera]
MGCNNGLNTSIWSYELGDGTKYGPYTKGWGNNEIQCYTDNKEDVKVGYDGVLAIHANFHRRGVSCYNPGASNSTRWWTSARLITRGKVAFGIGSSPIKIEARVKVPN